MAAATHAEADEALSLSLPALRPRHLAAVTAGNALEFYDFLTYAYFAGQIGRTFFPSADPGASLLASLAAFGAGFMMRPVGALVIGRMGDRLGRKPAMLLTFALMGLSMIGLALIPSYRAIGVAAPLLAVLCRLAQGFALGGEVGPTTAFMIEAAAPGRRGVYVSLQSMSQQIAILASGLIGLALSSSMPDAMLDAWGWRLAFLAGGVIVPFGFMLRRDLPETLHATLHAAAAEPRPTGWRLRIGRIAGLGTLMLAGATIVTYVLAYLTTYASATLHMPTRTSFLPTVVGGLCAAIAAPAGGWLSDHYGRKRVMILPAAVLLAATIPAFQLIAALRTGTSLMLLAGALGALSALAFTPVLVALTEALPARIRSGGLGLIYAVAIAVFGGSTQWIIAWLTRASGSPLAPAWYMTGALALCLVGMLLTPETAPLPPRPGRRRADRGL